MVMEAALVGVATGALKPVLGKLGTLLAEEYRRFKGVRKEIKSLTHELAAMEAFLLRMSEVEDPDAQDKVWMNEVRELSYDMVDAIDDFMQSVDDEDEKPDGFIEKIKKSLGKLGKLNFRRRSGRDIQDLKKQITEVGDRNARYRTGVAVSNSKNATVDPRALAIFEHDSKLVGIDEPKVEIIKLLTQEDGRTSAEEPLKVVSIVGSGGTGKTTLAYQVYQDLKGKFDCSAFLSVSRNPDMIHIMRTIHSQVSRQEYSKTEAANVQQVIINISNFLADKRYFVVVDDIWDIDTWDIIKCAFPTTSYSNRIITTTRMNNVAHSCCSTSSGHIYNIRPLNMVHSMQLFHRRLFKPDENCPSYLQEVSKQILEKCHGLPLAIVAISGLLANTGREENMWNQVKDSIGRALERNSTVEGMMKILSLSYFDLPPYLKTCLLYLSIYLEDSTIGKKGLIKRWIAEGFIHTEGRYTTYDLGEMCFNELLNRGLIQPVETNEYDKVESCRVHDTILDFIISKSIEENFVTLLGDPILTIKNQSKVVRRLCLQGAKEGNSTVLTTGLVLSHVRSLIVVRGAVEIPSLAEFRHLRVLDLSDQSLKEQHLENIVKLFQLRYLNLECTIISKLPEQIGRLGFLQMLDLSDTCVEELPTSIINLGKLSHLLVDNYVKFPDGIAKMQALETLEDVRVSIQPFDFLWGLGQLKNLRNLQLDLRFEVDSDTEDTYRDRFFYSRVWALPLSTPFLADSIFSRSQPWPATQRDL
ncbi:hypothetical protein CFC21_090530 [Triticum aestivum]|uniref:Uncharacterized protein n=2 Tax=Triticum aestivum TaxID=4565 RepID=A0A3B6PTC9_WHEAT|nr:hypothetical protein CFC21_090530 [Triticum aestivum]